MNIEGLPEGLELVRIGFRDYSTQERYFINGRIPCSVSISGPAVVVKAAVGYELYTEDGDDYWKVSKVITDPIKQHVSFSLQNTRQGELWNSFLEKAAAIGLVFKPEFSDCQNEQSFSVHRISGQSIQG